MAKLIVNIGSTANAKNGDPLRTAFDKINQNFTELYTLTGGTNTALTELAQDYAAPLFNHASHTNITATYDDANNKILLTGAAAQVQTDWNASSGLGVVLNKPALFSGSYTDLTSKPTLFSGSYTDLTNKPTIPTSFSSLVNGANSVSLDNGGLDLTFTSGEKIKTVFGGGIELYRSGDNTIGIYASGAEIKTFATGGAKHLWTFGTNGKLSLPNNGKITSGVDVAQVGSTTTIALNNLGTDQANNNINVGIDWTGNEAVFTTYAAGSTITFANGDVRTITEIQKNEVYGEPGVFAIDIYWSTGTPRENLTAFPITLKTSNYVAAYTAPQWTFGTNGNTTFPTGLVLGAPRGPNTVNFTTAIDKSFQIETGTSTTSKLWSFGTDGTTTFPTNISINYSGGNVQFPRIIADSGKAFSVQAQGNSGSAALAWTVDPNAASQYAAVAVSRAGDNLAKVVLQAQSDSSDAGTAKLWKFDQAGTLTFPDATTQTTAWKGIPGPYADDEAATLAGVALGSPYHKTGTGGQVFVRLTSPT